MKKIPVLTLAGLLFTAACIILLISGYQVWAAASGMLAFFLCLQGVKKETDNWQIPVFIIVSGIFGYAMCPANGLFCMTAAMILVSLVASLRLLLFQKLGHAKMKWIEPVLFIAALAYYVLGNIFDGSGWISWTFAAPPMGMAAFMTIGGVLDDKYFQKNKGHRFAAQVGQAAPLFSLSDQDGNEVNLSDYKGKRHVLLIFVRGDWCPTCHIMLRTYEKNKEKFAEKNVMLLAIGPDPVGVNRDMVIRLGLDYKLLSDDKHVAAKAYGMQIQENNPMTKYDEGIPLPASFLVDINGNVIYTSNPENPGEILNPATIFPVIDALKVQ
jgi:peroxiredoxin